MVSLCSLLLFWEKEGGGWCGEVVGCRLVCLGWVGARVVMVMGASVEGGRGREVSVDRREKSLYVW